MARAAKLNVNCGLARGWRQIGVRSLTEVPTTPVVPVRTWILKSAPRYWTMEQVTNFLEASNFGSIGFVSKKWEKFVLPGFSRDKGIDLLICNCFTVVTVLTPILESF